MRYPILLALLLCAIISTKAFANNDRLIATRNNYHKSKAAIGEGHVLEIRNGTLWAWGHNNYGQLGDGTNQDQHIPVQIGTGSNWVSVVSGGDYSVGIKADGTLWSWGRNHRGQLGDGTYLNRNTPVQIGSGVNWSSIAAGDFSTTAIKSDGTLWFWGRWTSNPTLGDTSHNWVDISIGATGFFVHTAIALRSNGTLWDISPLWNNSLPIQAGNDTWSAIAAGGFHGLAIKKDGTLWAWGDNYYGQTANALSSNINTPAQIGSDSNWVDIAASRYHSMGVKSDGKLYSWGYGGYDALGRYGDPFNAYQAGNDNNWVAIHAGWYNSIGIKADGTINVCGMNQFGQLSNDTITRNVNMTPVHTSDDWVDISAGGSHSIGIKADGTLWAWGQNDYGQLGDGTSISKSSPVRVGVDDNWTRISAGITHCLAIKVDGTLWAWGQNDYGQLGDGTTTNRNVPMLVDTSTNWVAIAAGGNYSLAIKVDGTLWAWGHNYFGELGDGTNIDKTVPVQIGTSKNWISVSTTSNHTIALRSDGTLWSWGHNNYGQLGDGTNQDKSTPVKISIDSNWISISAGFFHALALKADGTLWSWGRNQAGELGDNTTISKNVPVQVGISDDWMTISSNASFSFGIKTDGTLWSWGTNHRGQLGLGSFLNQKVPKQVGNDDDWVCIDAGSLYTLAIKADRKKVCATGDNDFGNLGDGTNIDKNVFHCSCPGYIYTKPEDKVLCNVGNTYFKIHAKYIAAYKWQVNTGNGWVNIANNAVYNGANEDSLSISNINTTYDNYWYRCIVYNACSDYIVSDSAKLSVNATPMIVTNPIDTTICISDNAIFSVESVGTNHQWQVNSGTAWNDLANGGVYSGVNTDTLKLTGISTVIDGYRYRCIVSNLCTLSDTSLPGMLTVDTIANTSVTITSNDISICDGQLASFVATPINGGNSPIYQWQINGVDAGTNNSTFTTNTLANNNYVRCYMTSSLLCPTARQTVSNNITVNVTDNVTPAIGIASNVGNYWCSGKEIVFKAIDTNAGSNPNYQWKVNGNNVGVNIDTLWMPSLQDKDVIECVLNSSHKCAVPHVVSSNKVYMTINETTSSNISIASSSDSFICLGQDVTLYTWFTNGGATPKYQWIRNGKDMPGETNATLKSTALNDQDVIECRFTSSARCVFPEVSNSISFDVGTTQATSVDISVYHIGDGTYVFKALPVNGGQAPKYRWFAHGKVVQGETGDTYITKGIESWRRVQVEMVSSLPCVTERVVMSRNITTSVSTITDDVMDIELYPNPNSGKFSVNVSFSSIITDGVKLEIVNSLGQLVYSGEAEPKGEKLEHAIDLRNRHAAGTYMLRMIINDKVYNKRFVISE